MTAIVRDFAVVIFTSTYEKVDIDTLRNFFKKLKLQKGKIPKKLFRNFEAQI